MMQTFLPYPDFEKSARVLDYRRLGKQRLEVRQILQGFRRHHPASKMWRGYEYLLAEYGEAVCREWISRGYRDNMLKDILELKKNLVFTGYPPWFGDEAFHSAHRSNLMRKKPEHYSKYFNDPSDLPYVWPSGRDT